MRAALESKRASERAGATQKGGGSGAKMKIRGGGGSGAKTKWGRGDMERREGRGGAQSASAVRMGVPVIGPQPKGITSTAARRTVQDSPHMRSPFSGRPSNEPGGVRRPLSAVARWPYGLALGAI